MLLECQFGISEYEVNAEGNIRVYSHLGKQGRLNKAFVENGIEVLKINISEEGLEDYFTKLVGGDRKSTRLNSSHVAISYAVFCLKKKKTNDTQCNRQH